MGVMGMVVVLLAQAEPLPANEVPAAPLPASQAPAPSERQIAVPETALPASVDVRSDMGKRFKLVEERVALDGREVARRVADPGHELEPQFRAFDGEVTPGPHQVTVSLVYEGRNVGLFTYLDDYKVRLQSSADFTAQDRAHPIALQVLAYQRSGITIPVEQKPTMEVKVLPAGSAASAMRASTSPR